MPSTADVGWADVADLGQPGLVSREGLNHSFVAWMRKVECQVADVAGFTPKEREVFCMRAGGPRFVARSAFGHPGTNGRRFSAVTVAWRTVTGWLTDIARALGARDSTQVVARARRVQWLFRVYSWAYLGESGHANIFRSWVRDAANGGVAWQGLRELVKGYGRYHLHAHDGV